MIMTTSSKGDGYVNLERHKNGSPVEQAAQFAVAVAALAITLCCAVVAGWWAYMLVVPAMHPLVAAAVSVCVGAITWGMAVVGIALLLERIAGTGQDSKDKGQDSKGGTTT